MPARLTPSAKPSGSGSGWRPRAGSAGAASQRSRSTKTAPGRWPASNAAAPERPSRYQRTSATTTSSRCSASQAASTKGGSEAIDASGALERRLFGGVVEVPAGLLGAEPQPQRHGVDDEREDRAHRHVGAERQRARAPVERGQVADDAEAEQPRDEPRARRPVEARTLLGRARRVRDREQGEPDGDGDEQLPDRRPAREQHDE